MLIMVTAGLSGCATSEYIASRDFCSAEWHEIMPPKYEEQRKTLYREYDVYTGGETCKLVREYDKDNDVYKEVESCRPNVRTIREPYEAIVSVDVRKAERNAKIRACAINSCMRSHGNPECKFDRLSQ